MPVLSGSLQGLERQGPQPQRGHAPAPVSCGGGGSGKSR